MLSRREQVAPVSLVIEPQEPLFGRGVRLDRAVMQDMTDSKAPPGEVSRHQQTAMTIERLSFRTHQAKAGMGGGFDQAVEAGAKSGCAAIAS